MNPLSYKEVFDPYHTIYRYFRLKSILSSESNLSFDHLRILDFFLANPFRLHIISFKSEHVSYRKIAKRYLKKRPYSHLPNDFMLFEYMKTSQTAAISSLARNKFVRSDYLEKDKIKFTDLVTPTNIEDLATKANETEGDLCELLGLLSSEYKLLGPNGLKKRTGLMEYRNDFIQADNYS